MDIRILTLLVLIGVLGSFTEARSAYFGYPNIRNEGLRAIFAAPTRLKRAVDSNGSGPNYAWTGMSGGPGYSAAGASAGASTGTFGYPGMGYPMTGNPMTGFPSAGSPTVDSRGGFQDNSANSPNLNGYPGYGSGGIDPLYNGPGFYFPGQFPNYNDPYEMFRQIQSQIEAQHRAIAQNMAILQASIANQGRPYVPNVSNDPYISSDMNNLGVRGKYNDAAYQNSYHSRFGNSNMEFHNRLASEAANYDGAQLASASIGVGPTGGFQAGQISPAAPGIESRFAEELPPPSGNSYGVFASSSSSSMTGPDGKQINHKISTTGVNDNGQISFRTVHDK